MPRTEKYFLGPQLLDQIRTTVSRVEASPYGSGVTKIPTRLQDGPVQSGGGSLKLGKTTALWTKGTLQDIVEYGEGSPPVELTASPPVIIENCVNKFTDVLPSKWVMLGRFKGSWYLIAAEC